MKLPISKMMVIALTAALSAVVPTAVHAAPVTPAIGTSDSFTVVAAAPKADVTTSTGKDVTHTSNGSEWYLSNTFLEEEDWGSFGFAPEGMTISQNSADTSGVFDNNMTGFGQRLSWHMSSTGTFHGGWRAGSHVWLNDSQDAWRAIYTADKPTYYPSGPQNNVAQAAITNGGWTLCFAEPYGTEGSVINDVFAACGGKYLLVGGIAGYETPEAVATAAPDAPTAVTATGGDALATVAWTAPANNGGADIDSYRVKAVGFEAGCQAQAPATTCTVTGLPQNGKWTFTVTAHNSVGDSVPSDASNAVWTHDGCFQSFPEKSTIALGDSTVIHVWNALANKAVVVRIGGRKFAETADANGEAVITYTADGSAGAANLVGKRVTVIPVGQLDNHRCRGGYFLYIPKLTMRAKFRQGGPIQAVVRSVEIFSQVSFRVTDLADGTTRTVCEFEADDSGKVTCAGTADRAGNFKLAVFVDGVQMAGTTFTVTPKPGR